MGKASSGNCFAINMNCYTWGRFDVAECLEQIKQTPIRMVELPAEQARPNSLIPELMVDAPLGGEWRYSLPDLKELLAAGGFEVDSLDVFGYTGYPGSADFIERRVDFAQALGCGTIVLGCHNKALGVQSGTVRSEDPQAQEEVRSFMYSLLRDLGDYAAGRNVKLALEIHAGVMENEAEALRTMAEVDRENVGVNFDTANILYYNESIDREGALAALESLAGYVSHVHLKDIVRGPTRAEHVLCRLGEGEVDFRSAFDILHAADFYGPFSFEIETFHGATETDDIGDYQADVVASIEYIRSLGEFPD